MDSCSTCAIYNNCIIQSQYGNRIGCSNWEPHLNLIFNPSNDHIDKEKKLDIVKYNKELGLWLLDNKFSEEIRSKIIEFIGEGYELGFESGYSECKIVNFID
jgi:hypothetical protein